MLNQPTLQKLQTLRLHGMAEAFRVQSDPAQRDGLADLSFEERFALLVDQEWTWRQNRALARRLAQAKFRYRASVEDIDFRTARGLDRSLLRSWTQNTAWVAEHQNIFLLGPCGVGKSWLACYASETPITIRSESPITIIGILTIGIDGTPTRVHNAYHRTNSGRLPE
jgi:DNA replication protein DnaC